MSESPLQLIDAIKTGNIATAKTLIESGADVNQQDDNGWTPLNWAAGKGNTEIVMLLVKNGADVFKVGGDQRTPYMIALAAGHVEVVKFLRQAEDQVEGEKPHRPDRKYCKAYQLKVFRQFKNWKESRVNWRETDKSDDSGNGNKKDHAFSDDDIVFLHQDYTVTQSMWHNENVIFKDVTDEWKDFCASELKFEAPDDLDLIAPASSKSA